jgi:N-methylhydantoinase B
VEVTEAMSPLLIRRKEYRTDSGGPGKYRGGLGQIMEVVTLDDAPFAISANYDRVVYPARGRDGGSSGKPGVLSLGSGAMLKSKGQQTIPQHESVLIEMPGGGGLGDPFERDAEIVAEDVRLGMVSAAAAAADYGVVLRDDGTIDHAATTAARRQVGRKH